MNEIQVPTMQTGDSMTMREQIAILVRLQGIDSDIRETEKRLGNVDREMAALDLELKAFESTVKEQTSIREDYQKRYRSLESDVNMNLPKISKSKEKLASVKTNKEYQALLKEIEDLKKANSGFEDQMLEILERSDKAETRLSDTHQAFESAKIRVAEKKAGIEMAADKDRERLAGLQAEYQTVLGTANSDILKAYKAVRNRIGNLAIAKVEDAVCAGCHMNVPPQMYNELQRFESLMYCPQCQRIIYSDKL
jgi:predicted  nucleic acid-binding Zn-ribbon protein